MMTMHRTARLCAVTLLGPLAAMTAPCRADDYPSPTDDRVRISLGATFVESNTTLRADSSLGVTGTSIDGESRLGLPRAAVEPKFQATFRVDTRQRLSIDYFTLDRSGASTVAGDDIVFRDVIFIPGDPLQASLSLRTLGLTYAYSFWHTERLEIAATAGVHATDISAIAKVNTAARTIIQTEDQAGPVPTVGATATWVVSKRFYIEGSGQFLDAHVKNISGSLGIFEFDALYRLRENVSFALGYSDIRARLVSSQSNKRGLFDFNTRGPELFVRIAF